MSLPSFAFLAPLQDAFSIVLSKPLSVVLVGALLLFVYGAESRIVNSITDRTSLSQGLCFDKVSDLSVFQALCE